MHRFFAPPGCIDGERAILTGNAARQLTRVLRAHSGERIVVLDNSGWEYVVSLEEVRANRVTGTVIDRQMSRREPGSRITLYQAVLKGDNFEFVLQKGTELGVSVFAPVFCERSVPDYTGDAWTATRYPRWRRIISEAAEQSCRGRIPVLHHPMDFLSACDAIQEPAIIPWEEESGNGLRSALNQWMAEGRSSNALSVFIGPEGGVTEKEIGHARARGIVTVSLGARVLRAETAAIAVIAGVLYELGELGA